MRHTRCSSGSLAPPLFFHSCLLGFSFGTLALHVDKYAYSKEVVDHEGIARRDLDLDFEIPFRELGFMGVPHRSTAFVMPTVNCLVELIEMPFTVITMSEVNIVNLERVGFNLRNFDMTLVFKVPPPPALPLCFTAAHIGWCNVWPYVELSQLEARAGGARNRVSGLDRTCGA